MNLAPWIAAGVLATVLLVARISKMFVPKERLAGVLGASSRWVPVRRCCFAGAVIMRLHRGERATIVGDLVYLALAVFVAWGRFGPESFPG